MTNDKPICWGLDTVEGNNFAWPNVTDAVLPSCTIIYTKAERHAPDPQRIYAYFMLDGKSIWLDQGSSISFKTSEGNCNLELIQINVLAENSNGITGSEVELRVKCG